MIDAINKLVNSADSRLDLLGYQREPQRINGYQSAAFLLESATSLFSLYLRISGFRYTTIPYRTAIRLYPNSAWRFFRAAKELARVSVRLRELTL